MKLLNLSAEPDGRLHSWLPPDLRADNVVFLPDACPGKSPLPTGTAVLTRQENWRKFAISDCGCGMRLLKTHCKTDALTKKRWEAVAMQLRANKGRQGDLGGGNHFLDGLKSSSDGSLYFLIHTGSRNESGHVDAYIDRPARFDQVFAEVSAWAEGNRAAVQEALEKEFGAMDLVLDCAHNSYELLENGGAIIRKGSVKVMPGELAVIPSHMDGGVVLARATERVVGSLFSLSHGTGRTMSRSACKPLADVYDFAGMRERILIPESVSDSSLRTEGPFAYRDLDECLALLDGYLEELDRFRVIGYIGHL